MKQTICDEIFDQERALYNIKNTEVINCTFAGPADGESALKETRDVLVKNCTFSLRYPLWHARGFVLDHVHMDELTRAAIWYSYDGVIKNTIMNGIKCLRECENIRIEDSKAYSMEFGWKTRSLEIYRSEIEAQYFLLECQDVTIEELKLKGKYSFQYVENMTICNSYLDTKDAFWHGKNITVKDSVLKGEYLAWFSEGLTLINCKIIGTQPLCYCKDLKLINCTMEGTDLAFEYSEVEADIKGDILSVKNPKSGTIIADSVGEIIWDDPAMEVNGKVVLR